MKLMLPIVLLLLAGCVCAQDPAPKDEPVADPGIPADFNDYLRKAYPGLDPGGEHDLFAIKDPKDKAKRHAYTIAMTQLILEYMSALDMGSTVAKVFDQYSRGKEGNQVTFKVLHAVVLRHYPPAKPNITESQKLLREAAEQAPDYAYPWFLLAQFFEYPRLVQIENTSPRDVLAALDKALAIHPDFLRAMLLKAQVFLRANPPRIAEVKEMLAPFLKTIPPVLDDFEDVMMLFAACHSDAELAAKIKELMDSGKLSDAQKVRCLKVQVHGQTGFNQFDAAIDTLEAMIKLIKVAENPTDAIWAYERLGACWGTKAMRLQQADPEFSEPGSRDSFDKFSEAAEKQHAYCAEIERKHMPLALRGMQARVYAEFLVRGMNKPELALEWLTTYLKETDLASPQRTVLENLRVKIGIIVNPTEEGLLEMYEGYLAADDMENLAVSLGLAVQNVKIKGEHFKTERALKLFISLLDNRIRLTVGFAAFLAADTALQMGSEAPKQAGEAIATRFEKEAELNSDEQAELQADICDALILAGHRPSQERGIRHSAKLIEESTAKNLRNMMRGIVNAWKSEKFRMALKAPPAKPRDSVFLNAVGAAGYLKELADAVAKE